MMENGNYNFGGVKIQVASITGCEEKKKKNDKIKIYMKLY